MAGQMGDVVLKSTGISKRFPGVQALTGVSLAVRRGEVLALLGENGAGKSTLIKILSGVYSLDEGEMEMDGRKVRFDYPAQAKAAGIGIIHQELNYVPTVSVAENIYMGDMPKRGAVIDYKRMFQGAKEIMARIGVDIDPKTIIGTCTVAQKQLVEIAKVISSKVKVLIMDEPTSALNDVETENLFQFVTKAKAMGIAVIYISHKLDELFRVADRVVVLRDGRVTGEIAIKDATKESLITMMVGRKIQELYAKKACRTGQVALKVQGLTNRYLKGISFEARKGEIFGVYGLMGSGHLNIGGALFGQDRVYAGRVLVDGQAVDVSTPLKALRCGIAYVPAERKTEGLILNASVQNNVVICSCARAKGPRLIRPRREGAMAQKWIDSLKIKTPSPQTQVESLSGGNQQKVVLSKWLELEPEVLILNEPTRGIDVGAKAEIYRILDDLCRMGKCVIMVTSEMPELIAMSDRIMVMRDGAVGGILDGQDFRQERIIEYAIGG